MPEGRVCDMVSYVCQLNAYSLIHTYKYTYDLFLHIYIYISDLFTYICLIYFYIYMSTFEHDLFCTYTQIYVEYVHILVQFIYVLFTYIYMSDLCVCMLSYTRTFRRTYLYGVATVSRID